MSYIGNTPTQQNFVAGADQFSGNGSTVAFTLSRSVNTVFDIFVTVSNVPQDPFTAYTVAGNTLTFDSAPPSGTNNIDVVYRATNVQTFVPTPGVSTQLGLGSASAPSLTFIGDTNTGIFSPAADTIAFTEGGVEALRIDSNRNVLVGTTSASTPSTTGFISTANTFGFKNRIINGDMRIDQRNAGASVSVGASNVFPVDRFIARLETATGTGQRSSVSPSGFSNSLFVTTGTGAAPSAGAVNTISQRIEGFNIADLGWGTASAQAVTLSFWVRSSITGTYAFRVGNGSRTYVATYTINAANTFEQKSLTIPGDTSGTWATDNSVGMFLNWDLGSGSSLNTTAGAWQVGDFLRTSATVNLVATTNANIYITGVQLEKGSTATSFDYRPYGTELVLCQRYYYRWIPSSNATDTISMGYAYSTTSAFGIIPFPVTMRSRPTALETSGTSSDYRIVYGAASVVVANSGPNFSNASYSSGQITIGATAVMTANGGVLIQSATVNGYLGWSAEL